MGNRYTAVISHRSVETEEMCIRDSLCLMDPLQVFQPGFQLSLIHI